MLILYIQENVTFKHIRYGLRKILCWFSTYKKQRSKFSLCCIIFFNGKLPGFCINWLMASRVNSMKDTAVVFVRVFVRCNLVQIFFLSSPDFRHFNSGLLTVCVVLSAMPFDCANFGLLVSCSKSQFAENFLNSNEVNSGPLSKKSSFGIPCFANIAFICSVTIGEVLLGSLLISKYLE